MSKIGTHVKAIGKDGKTYLIQASRKEIGYISLIYDAEYNLIEKGQVQFPVAGDAVRYGIQRTRIF